MKKIFTLIASTILSVSLFALPPKTTLTVSANSKKAVTILVDGKNYSQRNNDDDVVIKNLAIGSHNIKVYQQASNNFFNKKSQLIYDGNVYVKPQSNTMVTINRGGKAIITEKPVSDYDYPPNSQNGGWNYNHPQAINDRAFDQMRYTVNNNRYESDKVTIAKDAISKNYFVADQVKTLLESFNYESNKLDIAKYMYDRTLDKENYYVVLSGLNYSVSKDELTAFIKRAR
jgi:hypothetical protein